MDKYKNKTLINLLLITTIFLTLSGTTVAGEWDSTKVEAMVIQAEKTVQSAFETLWKFRLEFDLADTVRDPDHTGVIGIEHSVITTTIGYKDAKEFATRPGWAGWLVRELVSCNIWSGADVAVMFSGSFPAVNIVVLAALQELDADVVCVSTIGASSYGANEVGFSWPEMERLLREEHVLKVGSSAVTLGGTGDRGAEWSEYGKKMAMQSVKRSNLPFIDARSLRGAINKRMRFFGNPNKYFCLINVGGGQAAFGGGASPRFNRGGWFFEPLSYKGNPDGVMDRFLAEGIPCLNLLYLKELDEHERIISQ